MSRLNLYFLILISFSFVACERVINHNYFKEKKIVAIQPFEDFDAEILNELKDSLQNTFGKKVYILPSIEFPKNAFTKIKTPRYRADTLIAYLRDVKPDSIDYLIGICEKDISCTKYQNGSRTEIKSPEWKYKDWGVFGLGYVPGPSCIVSSFRLKKKVSKAKYRERLRKVVKHEFGHNLGLPHCPNKNCLMTDGVESIQTVDDEDEALCEACWDWIR